MSTQQTDQGALREQVRVRYVAAATGHQRRLWLWAAGRLRLRRRLLRRGHGRGARLRGRAVRHPGPRPAPRRRAPGQLGLWQPDGRG